MIVADMVYSEVKLLSAPLERYIAF